MQKTLEELQVEFNKKYEEYLKISNDGTTSQLIVTTKADELRESRNGSRRFSNRQNSPLLAKRQELFKPIQDKAIKAVNDVAAENGFTYIFDVAGGLLLFTPAPESQDILPLVKTKLGLKITVRFRCALRRVLEFVETAEHLFFFVHLVLLRYERKRKTGHRSV